MTASTVSPRRGRRRAPRPAVTATVTPPAATAPAAPGAATTQTGSFADMPLAPGLAETLRRNGLTSPFPIQAAVLPDALAGRDVLGRGRTGSGKTLAFGLPLLTLLAGRRAQSRRPLALVLVPTRELAQQVTASLTPYAEVLKLRVVTTVGGLSINPQAQALARGAEIVVATPGRLADLVKLGHCRLDAISTTVLDEADQMSDIGFLPQVSALLDQTPKNGQRLLFSATLDKAVDRLVRRFLTEPVTHGVDPPTATVSAMRHHLLEVPDGGKIAIATDIAARNPRSIMFVATKRAADRLATRLSAAGLPAVAMHGGRSQNQRTRALAQFRTGTAGILVATNVAARGIHIDELDLVVNVDPPADDKDYLHRGGRTARAGRSGTVFTLVLPEQRREVQRLMTKAGIRPDVTAVTPGHPALVPA